MINNTISINNRVFKDCKKMSATGFYVYMCIKTHQNKVNENIFSVYDLSANVGIAKSTLIKNIKELIPLGYLKENNTYNSATNQYKTYFILEPKDKIHGVTNIDATFLEKLIDLVNNDYLNKRHLQIFLFLKYKEQQRSKTWKLSQSHISMGLGVTRNAVHTSLKNINLDIVNQLYDMYNDYFEYIYKFLKL